MGSNAYLLFAGSTYYPLGGADDYIGHYQSVDEAKQAFEKHKDEYDWAQIAVIAMTELHILARWTSGFYISTRKPISEGWYKDAE